VLFGQEASPLRVRLDDRLRERRDEGRRARTRLAMEWSSPIGREVRLVAHVRTALPPVSRSQRSIAASTYGHSLGRLRCPRKWSAVERWTVADLEDEDCPGWQLVDHGS
jgi:hypothetical protein